MSDDETVIWHGSPSHWRYAGVYAISLLLTLIFVVPILYLVYKVIENENIEYTITDERILLRKGVLSKTEDQVEIYRVKDVKLEEPFLLRSFGYANIDVHTSDPTHPKLELEGIPDGRDMREKIRTHTEQRRDEKGVQEVDYH